MKENNNQKNLLVRAYEKLLSILRNLPSLRKSTAMLYISIVAGLNAIAMIVITIFGALEFRFGNSWYGFYCNCFSINLYNFNKYLEKQ